MPTKTKADLRKHFRAERRSHVAAQPESVRALLLKRPPAPLLELVPEGAVIGLYYALESEAPAAGYARFFVEAGHRIALPRLRDDAAAMEFAAHTDPFGKTDLEPGPHGIMQPGTDAEAVVPEIVFAPLVAFTDRGERLGQGGGHYDRWLAAHPDTLPIGLAWDVQRADALPTEPHDRRMVAVVTPTRLYGPFPDTDHA